MNVSTRLRAASLAGLLAGMGLKMKRQRAPRAFTSSDQAALDAAVAKRECRRVRNLRLVDAGGFR